MTLNLAFSPCPNDTFIFDAMVNKHIDTEGLDFNVHLEDVQTLNTWAIAGKMDVSKISYGVLPLVANDYNLLSAGGALGKGVGPLLIAKNPIDNHHSVVPELSIAIPGVNTTAHLLFSMAFPGTKKKHFVVFNQVEDMVLSGEVDAGVIIHENRFTYQDKGLHKIVDLGSFWEQETNAPIPLGGIVMRKCFDPVLQSTINRLIQKSVAFAYAQYPELSPYVLRHAQEMDETVMRQHIDLYVNDYSVDLGLNGERAINTLMEVYKKNNPDHTTGLYFTIVR